MPQSSSFTRSKGLAMLQCKCPRCQTGKMFLYPATNVSKFTEMYEVCPSCNLRFEIEPGFFWGAMYVSYFITTGMMLVTSAVLYLLFNDPGLWWYVGAITGIVIITMPWIYRYSRVLMLYLFSPVRFDKNHTPER